jgi:hypothetical protein
LSVERNPRVVLMIVRRLILVAAVSLSSLVSGMLLEPPSALAESCSNAAERVGFSADLPDCRAYEMVTPPSKNSGEPGVPGIGLVESLSGDQAATTGESMAYGSETAFPGSQSFGHYYLSVRGDDGWLTENVIPPQSTANGTTCATYTTMTAYSPDLSKGVFGDGWGQTSLWDCGHDEPLLVAGEPEGFQNLFVRENGEDSYKLVDLTPGGVAPADAYFEDALADLSHVVFREEAPLVPKAPSGEDLYEWDGSEVRLVTILPKGTPVHGALADSIGSFLEPASAATYMRAVSNDGARVFFEADGNLYVRENGTSTVQIDETRGGSGPGGGGTFMAASASGSEVFFIDAASAGLTADTVPGSGQNLYQYDLETGTLVDLTATGEADVEGVSGTSEDGAYVYFVAQGALAENENSEGVKATPGGENLYLLHAGARTFIATLDGTQDACDWDAHCLTARVTPNGTFIGFNSISSLTGYDNTDANSSEPDDEIFLYDVGTDKLSCASCNPSGAAPTGGASILRPETPNFSLQTNGYLQRNVSESGQVFFETPDALVPTDSNGKKDVYEYENGQLQLISSGTSSDEAYFFDASVNGSDVFFATSQQTLPRDTDEGYDVYDARVDGGFPEPASTTACGAEDCKGPPAAASAFSLPSSAAFVGAGNQTPSAVKKTVKSIRKKPKQKPKQSKQKPKRKKRSLKKDKRRAAKRDGSRRGSRVKRAVRSRRGGAI